MSNDKILFAETSRERIGTQLPNASGRPTYKWQLTDTAQSDTVKLVLQPAKKIPIVFVPGIMGSNLASAVNNKPVWLLNSVKNVPVGLAFDWAKKDAGERQQILHPMRTRVYNKGAVPKDDAPGRLPKEEYLARGWGEVSEASYHEFLLWLDRKMNADSNPASWDDFSSRSAKAASVPSGQAHARRLSPGLTMTMNGLPSMAEPGHPVAPIFSDELLKRSRSNYPVYAFGYNWLASNTEGARLLKARIEKIIAENNVGITKCNQVIIVTHSMGGLVARACSQLPDMFSKIVGIVHGVMPATGAAVAYRRCKVGMKDEDATAGLVIGSNGPEVTAVFAQAPGALQLLPSEEYGTKWMRIIDPSGKTAMALPERDPYLEIYLQKDKWWGLIGPSWLKPRKGVPFSWDDYVVNIETAKAFHRNLSGKYHHNTFVIYGGGTAKGSFSNVSWQVKRGVAPSAGGPGASDVANLVHSDVRTDGSNDIFVGGQTNFRTVGRGDSPVLSRTDTSFWELRCAMHDSAGDGTVPSRSGKAPRQAGNRSILQQFEIPGVAHEPAYRDYPVFKQVAYYAITKLAAMANEK